MTLNFRVILKSRPGANGEPCDDNFEYESCAYPRENLQSNEVIVKALYLSIDPAMRCCLNESTGVHYLQPIQIGETVTGLGGLGVIVSSKDPKFQPGDVIARAFNWPWQLYFITKTKDMQKVDTRVTGSQISLVLSCLGLTGLTSLLGIREKGAINSKAEETFVVSGAAGACGSLAGQIARIEGCKTIIGICGTDEKCCYLTEELGFNSAINYKSQDVEEELRNVCPNGIDIYFDNVGGDISDCVIQLMNPNGRVILCGQISQYNKDIPYPPPINQDMEDIIKEKNIQRERFLVLNYVNKFEKGLQQLAEWLMSGKLKVRETIEEGLENAGKAFVKMMKGENIGKQIVHVADI